MTHSPADAPESLDLQASARLALACLDLTSLNEQDQEADIERLCRRAQGPHGPVAAVCVWPRLAAFARSHLPASIAVAGVANFPDGSADLQRALRETDTLVQGGAQEVDVVLPYRQLLAGDLDAAADLLRAVRQACPGLRLKVILETGALREPAHITQAARLALDAGADFLKTSTGKTAVGATPQAARLLLASIAADPSARQQVGFKASGGLRTVRDVAAYAALCAAYLGPQALTPQRFRIGASSVLDDIEAVLDGRPSASATATSVY